MRKASLKAGISNAGIYGALKFVFYGFFLFVLYIGALFVENEVLNPNTNKAYTLNEVIATSIAVLMVLL